MSTIANLSPLAFHVLKYLCNTNEPDVYQTVDKLMFGIDAQEDFLSALNELAVRGLVTLSRDADVTQDIDVIDYTSEVMYSTDSPQNNAQIQARVNDATGDICGEISVYLDADKATNS